MKDNTNKKFWQMYSKVYTTAMSTNNKAYDAVCRDLDKYIDKSKTVLELACGTGQLSFRMAGKAKTWLATDYSENMIKEATRRNTSKKVSFSVQDATNLTYKAESFDVVVIANALHIMPEPDKALKEIHRVLKENGIIFAPTFVYKNNETNLKIRFMEKFGFKTYSKWTAEDLSKYIESRGFATISTKEISAKPLTEFVFVGSKK